MVIVFAYVPALFMLVGLLMFALCANPKLARVGEMLFFAGAISFAIAVGHLGYKLPA